MSSSSAPDKLSVSENVQLMLNSRPGRIETDGIMTGAAALIELVLLGRIGSTPNRSLFNGGAPRKLIALDSTLTGDDILDAALAPLAGRLTPQLTHRVLLSVANNVSQAVCMKLESRGLVQIVGGHSSRANYLEIVDSSEWQARRDALGAVRSRPEHVDDPAVGAFIDVLRNGAPRYTGEQGLHPAIRWEWYPLQSHETIAAVLQAERIHYSNG